MGIQGLMAYARKVAPDAFTEHNLTDFAGQTLVVDAMMMIYQICRAYTTHNSRDEMVNHLTGFAYKVIAMRAAGITPIFAFESRSPLYDRKLATLEKRKIAAEGLVRITKEHQRQVQELLTRLGATWFVAAGEGEAAASALVQRGIASAVITEDSDCLAYGVDILRGFNVSGKKITRINIEAVRAAMNMDPIQFIQFAILLGTDYSPRVYGPVTARKKFAAYDHDQELVANYMYPEAQLPADLNLIAPPPDPARVEEYLRAADVSDTRITSIMTKLKKVVKV